jgi:tRNA1Val (adenine37-N6)-methyltransferase
MAFRCKHFSIDDSLSSLKIGTDAMLLGAWADISSENRTVLDIGTGCGIIALMIAQRYNHTQIHGIDIHEGSIENAISNGKNSSWTERLSFDVKDLNNYSENFDIIISNPPFFENSTKNQQENISNARHTDSLSFREIFDYASKYLSKEGQLFLVLPFENGINAINYAQNKELFLNKQCFISPFAETPPNRILLEFRKSKESLTITEKFSIRTNRKDNQYTKEYSELLKDFLLIF